MNRMKQLTHSALVLAVLAAGVAHADVIVLDPPNLMGPAQVITITAAGTYRLAHSFGTSGISSAIKIQVPNVTLDLDGNAIDTNGRCGHGLSFGNSCTATATTAGLIDVNLSYDGVVRIINGSVLGAPGRGISVGGTATYGRVEIEDVTVAYSRNDGINIALGGSSVRHSRSFLNAGNGFYIGGPDSVLQEVHADYNGSDGIYGASNLKVEHSSANNNGVYGVDLPIRGTADSVVASDNGSSGFFGASYVKDSQARGNHGSGFDQVKFVLDSEALSNTLSGYTIGSAGCYGRLRASGNGSPQIGATAVALAGTTATCP